MEPNPIYQGTQFTPAKAAQAPQQTLRFTQEYEQGLQGATDSLQDLSDALIQVNDNTALLNQQAEAKELDLSMTVELGHILSLPNGADGGFYDKDGILNKKAVRDFMKRYAQSPNKWAKGMLNPDNQQKSMLASQAYQTGIREAIETALLANTKKREQDAYKKNIELSLRMGEYEQARDYNKNAYSNSVIDEQTAALNDLDIERKELASKIDKLEDVNDMLDFLENSDNRVSFSHNPDLVDALVQKIGNYNKSQSKQSELKFSTNSDSAKLKAIRKAAAGAPYYVKQLVDNYGETIPADLAYEAVFKYLYEEITETKDSETGAKQWNDAKLLAKSLGVTDEAFNNAYEIRAKQLTIGGFNATAILNNIVDNDWLYTTDEDERLPEDMSDKEKERQKALIAQKQRDLILKQYNVWWTQNEKLKPNWRQQYTKLLEIVKRRQSNNPDQDAGWEDIGNIISQNAASAKKREIEVAKEVGETLDRKAKSKKVALYIDPRQKTRATNPLAISSNVSFSYELAAVDSSLEGSKDESIIYLPKSMKIPAEYANVTRGRGNYGFRIKFKHSDKVTQPTPSRMLLRELGSPTSTPRRIKWDGVNLTSVYDEYGTTYSLFPDDGLVPEHLMPEDELPIE